MTLTIHGGKPSPFARKVITVFEEKGVAYQSENLIPMPKTPELMEKNPLGKIPILEHDGSYIPDSSVIVAYLERLHPENSVYPEDPKDYARALFLEEYADTKGPEALGNVFFERFIKKQFFQQEPDESIVAPLLAEAVPALLDYLETQLEPGAEFLVGARFSVADAAWGAQLGGLHFAGEKIDPARHPKVAAYVEKLFARPSFKNAMAIG